MDASAITIRRAGLDDAAALRDILNEVIEDGTAFVYDVAKNLDETIEMWLTYPVESYVAHGSASGEIVGAYYFKPNFPGRGSHIANATYMVKRNQHGRGIGRLLGSHSLQQARLAGYRALQFNAVVSTNRAAVALWESLGFARIGTVPQGFRLNDGRFVDLYIMFQPLIDDKADGDEAGGQSDLSKSRQG
jgi:L-amino acid N-acyltransferase YncA